LQVKKEVLDKLGLTNSPGTTLYLFIFLYSVGMLHHCPWQSHHFFGFPVNHPEKMKATANLPQKTKAAAPLPQKSKGIGMYFSKRCLPPEEAINALAASPELRLKSKTVQGSNGVGGAPQVDLFPSPK
jgi:hypothetical protein